MFPRGYVMSASFIVVYKVIISWIFKNRKSIHRASKDKSRYFRHTLYLHRYLRAKQLLRASELMRAAYHEKEVQFNPIKDNQRPTATRDEYLLLFWWLNGSTERFAFGSFLSRRRETTSWQEIASLKKVSHHYDLHTSVDNDKRYKKYIFKFVKI